jgi:hypothetical protein
MPVRGLLTGTYYGIHTRVFKASALKIHSLTIILDPLLTALRPFVEICYLRQQVSLSVSHISLDVLATFGEDECGREDNGASTASFYIGSLWGCEYR